MKTRKDTILKLIAIPFIMMAFTISIFLLCDNNVKAASDTTVALKQDGQNVKVSINPKEGVSIASFQIGLKIDATKASDIKNVTFNWADIGSAKLKKESYDKENGILNLYVVTEAEQNTGSAIEVGTIKIETNKSTKVTVSPIADKTTASSIAYKDTKVDTEASDKITYIANSNSGNQGGNTGDNNQGGNQGGGSSGSGNQGNGNSSNQGGNTSGSGSNSGSSSTGNGNGSNSGDNTDNKDDEDKDNDEDDEEEENDENNVEDTNEIDDDSSSNQVDNVATGALPQTGEKDNFMAIWIVMALVVLVGVLLAFGYKTMNKKNTFKL